MGFRHLTFQKCLFVWEGEKNKTKKKQKNIGPILIQFDIADFHHSSAGAKYITSEIFESYLRRENYNFLNNP